jgi:hypothetical protein
MFAARKIDPARRSRREWIERAHDPEKCEAVFRKDHAQKQPKRDCASEAIAL